MKFGIDRIILTVVFIWAFIGACFFPPAIPVVIILYIIAMVFPRNRVEAKKYGEKTREVIDTLGAIGEETGRTTAALTYHGGRIVKGTVEEFYKRIGGEEGAKRIINILGKFSVHAGKIFVEAVIVTGKVVVTVTKYGMKRIEQERDKLDENERRLLDEDVEWNIVKNNAEFVNFVNRKDD